MKIEIWSDYACPYCYIGKRQLEKALENFSHMDNIDISFKSFELDPSASYETTSTTKERVAKKYGYSSEQAQQMIDNVTAYANQVGLDFHYGTTRYTNTFDAHRISKYAETKGKGAEISEKLLHGYFIENKQMSDHKVLTDIAVEVGLDKTEVEDVLKNKKFAEDVRRDELEANTLGIHSVPCFVINEKYAISGAQPADAIKEIIEKSLKEEMMKKFIDNKDLNGMSCGVNGCSIPNNNK
ncbi:MAG: DsbA family oxidoreductase [Clostridium perfringens]|nr:DsbA family oxidoreductase [Clostridium perfringens]